MKVAVIGCGYLGAVHAAAMAELGHEVVGVEIDPARLASLQEGKPEFYEPGLEVMLQRHLGTGRLSFSNNASELGGFDVFFIGVGTPIGDEATGAADLSYVYSAIHAILDAIPVDSKKKQLVVGKSTVPVGTANELYEIISRHNQNIGLIWNPEFLREGFGLKDTLEPDRIVYGIREQESEVSQTYIGLLDDCYRKILDTAVPRLIMNYPSAELVKVAANSFLATKLSFMNAISDICDMSGADVTTVAKAIGLDDRIGGKFLKAGLGYGGGCLPKDVAALIARSNELSVNSLSSLLQSVQEVNVSRADRVLSLLREELGSLPGKKVAILGASFKPKSDDLRESRAILVAQRLASEGAEVLITDPMANGHVRSQYPHFSTVETVEEAVKDSNVVLLLTEWEAYTSLSPDDLSRLVANKVIFDGRNSLDPLEWKSSGWVYLSLGRASLDILV